MFFKFKFQEKLYIVKHLDGLIVGGNVRKKNENVAFLLK